MGGLLDRFGGLLLRLLGGGALLLFCCHERLMPPLPERRVRAEAVVEDAEGLQVGEIVPGELPEPLPERRL